MLICANSIVTACISFLPEFWNWDRDLGASEGLK